MEGCKGTSEGPGPDSLGVRRPPGPPHRMSSPPPPPPPPLRLRLRHSILALMLVLLLSLAPSPLARRARPDDARVIQIDGSPGGRRVLRKNARGEGEWSLAEPAPAVLQKLGADGGSSGFGSGVGSGVGSDGVGGGGGGPIPSFTQGGGTTDPRAVHSREVNTKFGLPSLDLNSAQAGSGSGSSGAGSGSLDATTVQADMKVHYVASPSFSISDFPSAPSALHAPLL